MPQSIEELQQRVAAMAEIFLSILGDPTTWNNLGGQKQKQLTTGINKAYGQAMSFRHEYMSTIRNEYKGRAVVTQTHADVTVGAADALFAKSIECKSVTKPEKGAVNKILGDAIEQLGGQTGHHPRTDDVRVVDVIVEGIYNPWPLSGGAYGFVRAPASLHDIVNQAVAEVKNVVESGKPGALAIRNWLAGQVYSNLQQLGPLSQLVSTDPNLGTYSPFPRSTRPIYQDTSGNIHKIRCLTIKVRYDPGYVLDLWTLPNVFTVLEEVVVQVYHKPMGLVFESTKTLTRQVDLTPQ